MFHNENAYKNSDSLVYGPSHTYEKTWFTISLHVCSEMIARKKKLSPILDQIINGPPSVSLNVYLCSKKITTGQKLFKSNSLNQSYIFKYPNFDIELANENGEDSQLIGGISQDRPVETAVYLPSDNKNPQNGGYAIYLRQKNSKSLLTRHFGLSADCGSKEFSSDLHKLNIFDEIPSLDPFLIKTAFDGWKISLDQAYTSLPFDVEKSIKANISKKIRPIIERAVGRSDGAKAGSRIKFVNAIWDPSLPEAQLFIKSFRIDPKQSFIIFGAWKGLAFYEQQFSHQAPHIGNFLKWLNSKNSTPFDIMQNRAHKEQQEMFKKHIDRRIRNMINNVRSIFRSFHNSYEAFIVGSDPVPFRNYLLSASRRYWVLGYCCTALANSISVFNRTMEESYNGQISFDKLNDMLFFIDASINSRSNTHNINNQFDGAEGCP